MTDRLISLNAAIEAIKGQRLAHGIYSDGDSDYEYALDRAIEALSALPDAWQGIETAISDQRQAPVAAFNSCP